MSEPADLSLRDAADWARHQAARLAAHHGLDRERFALVQTVKLGEEVGELQAEVLGALRYCREDKADGFTSETLAGELADVLVCTLLLAETFQVDLDKALTEKIAFLRDRQP